MTNREIVKYTNNMTKLKIRCKCGHKSLVPIQVDKVICSWCGRPIYRNDKIRFICELKKAIYKLEMKERENDL